MNNIEQLSEEQIVELLEKKKHEREAAEKLQLSPMQRPVEWPYTRTKKIGKEEIEIPYTCYENTEALLDHYGYSAKYNEMSKNIEIHMQGDEDVFHHDREANDKITWIVNKAHHHGLPKAEIDDHVGLIAGRNSYHPVRDWIESNPWDGVSRLKQFYDTVVSDHPMKEKLMLRWAVMCVAAVYEPRGISPQGVLVFENSKQGLGKTSWLKNIVPSAEWIASEQSVDPKDKDSVQLAIGHWIIELAEIQATFSRSDIQSLKSFITRDKDTLRPAYAKKADDYARRTCFFGTVDEPEFLIDKNGNRRFWVLHVDQVDNNHNIDLQQLWAEVHQQYLSGVRWWLDREEIEQLNDLNNDFMTRDPIEDRLENRVSAGGTPMNTTEILLACGVRNPTKPDLNSAAKWLRRKGFGGRKRDRRFYVTVDSIE